MWADSPFAIHAALMTAAWLVMIPAGIFVARFGKVTRGQDYPRVLDNQVWWVWHRVLQYGGLGLAVVGVWVAYDALGTWDLAAAHVWAGLGAMALGMLQVASTWFRGTKGGPTDRARGADPDDPATWRGDHYDMTPRRLVFEGWHRPMGFGAVVLAFGAAVLGLQLAGAPTAVLLLPPALFGVYVALFVRFTLKGRRVPTYQAIWGPDPRHPGNRRPPPSF